MDRAGQSADGGQPGAGPGSTYASAAQGGTQGTAGGGAWAASGGVRAQIQAELDVLEDDTFLQAFFEEMPEQRDRRQRFVGRNPEAFNID